MGESLAVEILAPSATRPSWVMGELVRIMRERNVYRGRVLELRSRHLHGDEARRVTVRTLPQIRGSDRPVAGRAGAHRATGVGIADHACAPAGSGGISPGLLLHGPARHGARR
jgi:hypothetical protein